MQAFNIAALTISTLIVASFMFAALWRFMRLVKRVPFKVKFNHCPILVEILSILGFTGSYIGLGFVLLVYRDELTQYDHIRMLEILMMCG